MGLLVLLGIIAGVGAVAFKKGEKIASEKEIERAANKPLKIRGTDAFDHLLGLFAGGERTDLKKTHPEAVNKAKAIISKVKARAERAVFPAITWQEVSQLYSIARMPGPSLDKDIGKGGRDDVTEPLEFLAVLIVGGDDSLIMSKATKAESQAMKVLGATINNRWKNKVKPPITKEMLKRFYAIATAIRKRL